MQIALTGTPGTGKTTIAGLLPYKVIDINALVKAGMNFGKDPERGMRGTSALTGKADLIIKIDSKPGSGIIQVDIQKDRDGVAKPFTAEFVFLPDVGDGKPGIRIIILMLLLQ